MTVRPTAGMINLIFGQMAGITRASAWTSGYVRIL